MLKKIFIILLFVFLFTYIFSEENSAKIIISIKNKTYYTENDKKSLKDLFEKYKINELNKVFVASNKKITRKNFLKKLDNHYKNREIHQKKIKQIKNQYYKRSLRNKKTKTPFLENIYSLKVKGDIPSILIKLEENPLIEFAQINNKNVLNFIPNDPYYSSSGSWGNAYDDLYALKSNKLDMEQAWDEVAGLPYVPVVAVLDCGVDYSHEEIASNMWKNTGETPGNGLDDDNNGYIDDYYGYDFSNGDSDPDDDTDEAGHGTHVAGTIAAIGNNNEGIIGVAYNAKIMALKIFDNALDTVAAEAIKYAADNGADVINCSWGPPFRVYSNPVLEKAVAYAYSMGAVIVFSANNNNDDVAYYAPANSKQTIAVASTDYNDEKANSSNFGDLIDVSAPGVEILSLRAKGTDMYNGILGYIPGSKFVPAFDVNAKYFRANGTSMAAPHVSGLLALLVTKHPTWSNELLRLQIMNTADNIDALNVGYENKLGAGRINAYKALSVEPEPKINLEKYSLNDITGNINGYLESNEGVKYIIFLKNYWGDAKNVVAKLSTTDPLISFTKDTINFGDILLNEEKNNNSNPFEFKVGEFSDTDHEFNFILEITGDGGYFKEIPITHKKTFISQGKQLYNFPNPFSPKLNGKTTIQFQIKENKKYSLYFINSRGQTVYKKTGYPSSGFLGEEIVTETWAGKTQKNNIVANGVYLVRVTQGSKVVASGKISVLD